MVKVRAKALLGKYAYGNVDPNDPDVDYNFCQNYLAYCSYCHQWVFYRSQTRRPHFVHYDLPDKDCIYRTESSVQISVKSNSYHRNQKLSDTQQVFERLFIDPTQCRDELLEEYSLIIDRYLEWFRLKGKNDIISFFEQKTNYRHLKIIKGFLNILIIPLNQSVLEKISLYAIQESSIEPVNQETEIKEKISSIIIDAVNKYVLDIFNNDSVASVNNNSLASDSSLVNPNLSKIPYTSKSSFIVFLQQWNLNYIDSFIKVMDEFRYIDEQEIKTLEKDNVEFVTFTPLTITEKQINIFKNTIPLGFIMWYIQSLEDNKQSPRFQGLYRCGLTISGDEEFTGWSLNDLEHLPEYDEEGNDIKDYENYASILGIRYPDEAPEYNERLHKMMMFEFIPGKKIPFKEKRYVLDNDSIFRLNPQYSIPIIELLLDATKKDKDVMKPSATYRAMVWNPKTKKKQDAVTFLYYKFKGSLTYQDCEDAVNMAWEKTLSHRKANQLNGRVYCLNLYLRGKNKSAISKIYELKRHRGESSLNQPTGDGSGEGMNEFIDLLEDGHVELQDVLDLKKEAMNRYYIIKEGEHLGMVDYLEPYVLGMIQGKSYDDVYFEENSNIKRDDTKQYKKDRKKYMDCVRKLYLLMRDYGFEDIDYSGLVEEIEEDENVMYEGSQRSHLMRNKKVRILDPEDSFVRIIHNPNKI